LNVFLPVAEERGRIAGGSPALPAVADEPSAVQKESRPTGGGTVGGGARPSPGDAMLRMRELIRLRHYSYSTEQSYLNWVGRYVRYCSGRGLDFAASDSMRSFLSYLAVQRKVASSTQNQAFNAVLFLLREVLGAEVGEIKSIRAKRGPKLPVVLSVEEVRTVLNQASGSRRLMLELVYGAGLRVTELVRLRVQDVDFENGILLNRSLWSLFPA